MAAGHSHSHSAGHHHHSAADMSENKIKLSLILTLSFVVIELFAGLRCHSLALLSDAGHNFTDALALLLSWFAIRIALKPAHEGKTYGYHRVGILTALFNALTLLAIAAFIFVEAIHLFQHPQVVEGNLMIWVALIAVFMNTVIAFWLRGEIAHSVNMRSAFIHMVGDALSAVGVVIAGIVIRFTGWLYADPLISVVIGLFIVYSSWGIVKETLNVLLEGTPAGLDAKAMALAMQSVPGVLGMHDLHVWTIGDGVNALSCHITLDESELKEGRKIVESVKRLLALEYSIHHSTIETECTGCESASLYCGIQAQTSRSCGHDH